MSDIHEIPQIRPQIKTAAENGSLAIFLGAGVSRIYGCDSWRELANRLVRRCFSERKKDGTPLITYKEKEYLLNEVNSKKVLTICKSILKENGLHDKYIETLKIGFKFNETIDKENIFDYIFKMGLDKGLYLTTNADCHFANKFKERIFYAPETYTEKDIDNSYLYHLHGNINFPSSLIFTVPEYLNHYSENNQSYIDFLRNIFAKYTVLFLGYGLDELEILEFMATKTGLKREDATKRFVLFPLFKGEDNILQNEQKYFNEFGIDVIGFQKDGKGYDQLIDVIKAWSKEIGLTTAVLIHNYEEIEQKSQTPTPENITRIKHLIDYDSSRKSHFLKCLVNSPNLSLWLPILYEWEFFKPENSPKPTEVSGKPGQYEIQHWDVLSVLEAVAKQNEINPISSVTTLLKKILQQYIAYTRKISKKERNDRTEWILAKVIGYFPKNELNKSHVKYLQIFVDGHWGNTLISSDFGKIIVPKFLLTEDKQLITELLKTILKFKIKNGNFGKEAIPYIDTYWLGHLLKNNLEGIIKITRNEGFKIVIGEVEKLLKLNPYTFSASWTPDLDTFNPDSPNRFEQKIIYTCASFIKLTDDSEVLEKILNSLLAKNRGIFKRLLFYLGYYKYTSIKKYFWKGIRKNPLLNNDTDFEIYKFFEAHSSSFTIKQIELILTWIENVTVPYKVEKDKKIQYEAYNRKKWLHSLLKTNHPRVISLYQQYSLINETPVRAQEHHRVTGGFVKRSSPYSIDELKILDIDDLIKKIITYEGPAEDVWDGPSKSGLATVLADLIKQNSAFYMKYFKKFLKLEPFYLYHIANAIREIESSERIFEWDKFLTSMRDYIHSISDWSFNSSQTKFSYQEAFIGDFFSILTSEFQNEKSSIDLKHSAVIKEIFLFISTKICFRSEIIVNDIVTSLLNSMQGKYYESLLNYMLWKVRKENLKTGSKWDKEFKDFFTANLNTKNANRTFYASLGKFFRNFLFLDEKWVWSNFKNIFPIKNEMLWKDSFSAHLFYNGDVYAELYKAFVKEGHYKKGLYSEFYSDDINYRIIDHISIAYLFNIDPNKSNNLIKKIIENGGKNLNRLIYFYTYRDKEKDAKKLVRIKQVWEKIHVHYKNIKTNESREIMSSLTRFQKHFDTLGENFELLQTSYLSIKYTDYRYDLLESLLPYQDKESELIADLILISAKNDYFFTYQDEILGGLIRTMYEKGFSQKANQICVLYLEKGFDWIRPIYDRNRSKKKDK